MDSDLDLLVEFDEDATLLDFSALELAYGELVHGPAQTEGWIELQLHIGRGDDRDRPSAGLPASAVRRKDSAARGSSVRLYGADSVVVRVKTPSEAFSMPNRPVPSVQTFSRLRYGTSAGTSVVRARRVHGAASHGGPSAAGEVTLVPLPLPIPVPLPRSRAAPSAQPATRSGPAREPSARTGAALRTAAGEGGHHHGDGHDQRACSAAPHSASETLSPPRRAAFADRVALTRGGCSPAPSAASARRPSPAVTHHRPVEQRSAVPQANPSPSGLGGSP